MMRRFFPILGLFLASCSGGPFFSANVPGGCTSDDQCGAGICDSKTKVCVDALDGDITVQAPAAGALTGGPQATFTAKAKAPGGPTKVEFRIEQPAGTVKETETVTVGDQTYSATMQLGKNGLVSGSATIYAKVFWGQLGKFKESAPIQVTLDMDAPLISAFSSGSFWSSTGSAAASTAAVSVQVADVGGAGVDASSVQLKCNGHTYQGTAGAGNVFSFSVPAGDLGVAAGVTADVSCSASAADKLSNVAAPITGVIRVDNTPPVLSNALVNPATSVGGAATISLSINAADTGGSGVAPASAVVRTPIGGDLPGTQNGSTFTFSIHGTDAQGVGLQGPVTVTFIVADAVGNLATKDVTVNVDRKVPSIGTVVVTANPAGTRGFYSRAAGVTVPVDVTVDDGANGAGLASVSLAINGTSYPQSTSTGAAGTARVFRFLVPAAAAASTGFEGSAPFTLNALDNAGNATGALSNAAWVMKIDDLGPVAAAVVVNGGVLAGTTKWFAQSQVADIDVQADVVDNGSGVDITSLHLFTTGSSLAQLDHGPATADTVTLGRYHFKVTPGTAGAAGAESTVAFKVVSADTLAHAQRTDAVSGQNSTGTVGVDGLAPSVGTPVPNKSFYTSTGGVAFQTAQVTASITDLGSGVGSPSLAANGQTFGVTTGSGNGPYVFTVPASAMGVAPNAIGTVPFTVTGPDRVNNSASNGANFAVDNVPPTFGSPVVPTSWYDGGTGVTIPVSVTPADPAGGSGLDSNSVNVQAGTTIFWPTADGGPSFPFALPAAQMQLPGTQGPVAFVFNASDGVGNAATSSQSLNIDRRPPTLGAVTVTDNAAGANGFYPRSASTIPVTIVVDDTDTIASGAASATLSPANSGTCGASCTTTTFTGGGTARTFSLSIPGTIQTAGSETALSFDVTGMDAARNPVTRTSAGVLKIDDLGPLVTGVLVTTTPAATVNSVPWFKQSDLGDIDVQATVTDASSKVNSSTLQLYTYNTGSSVCALPRVDHGTPTYNATTGETHFAVFRSGSGPVGAGLEGPVNFCVVAQDNVGNSQRTPVVFGVFGIDGAPPQWVASSFTPSYPAADCDLPSDSTTFFCGHDGSTFWKRGDGANNVSFKFSDNGSGVNASMGKYTLQGGAALTATAGGLSSTQRTFTFAADFSNVVVTTSATTGLGAITVTESATDLVGNVSTTRTGDSLSVTRVKWLRDVSATASQFKAAPVVTAQPTPQVIVGGTRVTGQDPIISLKPSGGILWTFGGTQTITVSANMAYDPTASTDPLHPTPILYAVTGTSLYAMHVTNAGSGTTCSTGTGPNCVDLFCSGSTGGLGAPALVGSGSTAAAIVADTGATKQLRAYQTANLAKTGGGCNQLDTARFTSTTIPIGAPTASGPAVYWGYNNGATDRGFANSTFNGLTFSTPVQNNFGIGPGYPFPRTLLDAISTVSISTSLFFADRTNSKFQAYSQPPTPAVIANWPVTVPATALPSFAPIVSGSTVIGVSDAPAILGFNKVNPATAPWSFSAAATASQPTAAADGTIYFADATTPAAEVVALKSDGTALWAFTGGGVTGTKTLLTFAAPASPPTIDSTGVVYLGTNDGKVLALISDTSGSTTASDWPTLGHDNCNSNNATFTCQ
jgi:hypothetical protein